jgi:acylphosphatase
VGPTDAPARYNHPFMLVGRRIVVSGRVQGVGFRYFALDAARREGVTGTVRNLDDGRVETVVEGDREAVERFERAVRRGPAGARVEDVLVDLEPPSGIFRDFRILP